MKWTIWTTEIGKVYLFKYFTFEEGTKRENAAIVNESCQNVQK